MPGGKGNIKPSDGKQFSSEYQPDKEIWTQPVAEKFCNDLIGWLKEDDQNIFYDEFIFIIAKPKDYHPDAKIYLGLPSYLAEKHTSCSKLLEKAKKIQEIKLAKFGTMDKLSASMTKFVLINIHDWKEKSETESTIKGRLDLVDTLFPTHEEIMDEKKSDK